MRPRVLQPGAHVQRRRCTSTTRLDLGDQRGTDGSDDCAAAGSSGCPGSRGAADRCTASTETLGLNTRGHGRLDEYVRRAATTDRPCGTYGAAPRSSTERHPGDTRDSDSGSCWVCRSPNLFPGPDRAMGRYVHPHCAAHPVAAGRFRIRRRTTRSDQGVGPGPGRSARPTRERLIGRMPVRVWRRSAGGLGRHTDRCGPAAEAASAAHATE